MQRNEHATATKHDNKIHGREAFKMLNKRLALSHGQFIHYEVQISMAKTQMVKQISDLVKLTLVWNFRSYSPLRSNKTTRYRT